MMNDDDRESSHEATRYGQIRFTILERGWGTIHASIPYTSIRWTLFPYPFVPLLHPRFLFSFFTFNFSINLLPLALSVSPIHPLIHIFPGCERVVFCSPTDMNTYRSQFIEFSNFLLSRR